MDLAMMDELLLLFALPLYVLVVALVVALGGWVVLVLYKTGYEMFNNVSQQLATAIGALNPVSSPAAPAPVAAPAQQNPDIQEPPAK